MPSDGATEPSSMPSVFLSYASEDRAAARSLRDALAAEGLDVWYDENELTGGDAWDQKIRKQIRDCDYFMPIVSAQSEARREGYFRREWRLAVERTLDMADDHLFLIPVVIDGTGQDNARVPERFLSVQWLRVPGGQPNPALEAIAGRLASGETTVKATAKRPPLVGRPKGAVEAIPPFPHQEPGQQVKFWFHVAAWLTKSAWYRYKRLPRLARIAIALFLVSCAINLSRKSVHTVTITPAKVAKLKEIASGYEGDAKAGDIAKLGEDIARELDTASRDKTGARFPLLAIPFSAEGDVPAEAKAANSTFALLYGRISVDHQGKVGLSPDSLPPLNVADARARGVGSHASYVIFGGIEVSGSSHVLTAKIVEVEDGSVAWTKSYPVGSDPETIASEVEANIPKLDED